MRRQREKKKIKLIAIVGDAVGWKSGRRDCERTRQRSFFGRNSGGTHIYHNLALKQLDTRKKLCVHKSDVEGERKGRKGSRRQEGWMAQSKSKRGFKTTIFSVQKNFWLSNAKQRWMRKGINAQHHNWNHGALKVLPIEPQMTVPRTKKVEKYAYFGVQVRVFKRK